MMLGQEVSEYENKLPVPSPDENSRTCSKCGCILSFSSGEERISKEAVCSDCYYDFLGDLVENHPIGIGR